MRLPKSDFADANPISFGSLRFLENGVFGNFFRPEFMLAVRLVTGPGLQRGGGFATLEEFQRPGMFHPASVCTSPPATPIHRKLAS